MLMQTFKFKAQACTKLSKLNMVLEKYLKSEIMFSQEEQSNCETSKQGR